jgi:iduronate 2-sulfatase
MRVHFSPFVVVFCLCSVTRAADRPNVLLICVDDLKPMLGCYGDTNVKSPHIDALAARGVLLNRAYCNQAVCSPSRNALLTGLRPTTLGIYDLATNFRVARPNAVTLPQYFQQHGYRTEGMGKIFHRGHGNQEDKASWSVPYWNANVVGYALPENRPANVNSREAALFNNENAAKANKRPKGAAYESADVNDNAYADGQVADEAIKRIQNAAKSPDQAFFLAVGFMKPHLPFCAPKKYWDLYDPASFKLADRTTPPDGAPSFAPTKWGELRNYAGMPENGPVPDESQRKLIHGYHAAVSFMDAQVGRVLHALDESSLATNTIVVLWGDHGWHLGDHGMWCKHTNYEQAARIPIIVADPRAKNGRGKSNALVESVDIYPTLCELAGLPVPSDLDGASFAKLMDNPNHATKDAILHAFPRGDRIGRAVRTDRYRLVEWKVPGADSKTAEFELYDYESDLGEPKNLAADKPEVVRELKKVLEAWPEAKAPVKSSPAAKQAKPGQRKKNAKKRAA